MSQAEGSEVNSRPVDWNVWVRGLNGVKTRAVVVNARLWYEAREIGSRELDASPLDVDAEVFTP